MYLLQSNKHATSWILTPRQQHTVTSGRTRQRPSSYKLQVQGKMYKQICACGHYVHPCGENELRENCTYRCKNALQKATVTHLESQKRSKSARERKIALEKSDQEQLLFVDYNQSGLAQRPNLRRLQVGS